MNKTNDQFIPIAIKDFAQKVICDGHLYLRSKEGRRFYLMQPGILIDENFIKKYASLSAIFEYHQVGQEDICKQFNGYFKELKYLQFERDLREKSSEIVKAFRNKFSNAENHFLIFALACFNEFNALPREDLLKLHNTDIHLFRKSLYSAAFSIIIALSNDFYHYPMLKDFYNLTFALDIGLCEGQYSYFVAEACNKENQFPGKAAEWMRSEKATKAEIDLFLNHPLKSFDYFNRNKSIFSYPELIHVALFQHEIANGCGFPRGIPKGQISGWEAVVILATSLVEIRDDHPFENSVIEYIVNFTNQKLHELPVQRTFSKLCISLADIHEVKGEAV
jgi:hypothetical protein